MVERAGRRPLGQRHTVELNPREFQVLIEELNGFMATARRHGAKYDRPYPARIWNRGTKTRHLPRIARGGSPVSGYSEPNAGSDLASLETRALDQGDHYLVNGSKIWTSGAMHADWIFVLCEPMSTCPNTKELAFYCFQWTAPASA